MKLYIMEKMAKVEHIKYVKPTQTKGRVRKVYDKELLQLASWRAFRAAKQLAKLKSEQIKKHSHAVL